MWLTTLGPLNQAADSALSSPCSQLATSVLADLQSEASSRGLWKIELPTPPTRQPLITHYPSFHQLVVVSRVAQTAPTKFHLRTGRYGKRKPPRCTSALHILASQCRSLVGLDWRGWICSCRLLTCLLAPPLQKRAVQHPSAMALVALNAGVGPRPN